MAAKCWKCKTKFHRVRSLCHHLRRCGKWWTWRASRRQKYHMRFD